MYCSKCGVQNDDNAEFCIYCGANIKQINGDTQKYTEKPLKRNNIISILDFSAILKGLSFGILIGIVTIGFIGMFIGGIITGYYTTTKKRKNVVINGWVVGFISMLIWAIISFLVPSSSLIKAFIAAENIIGSTGLTLTVALIIWLVLWALIALIGSIGGIIGLKISRRRMNESGK